jgi:hypothetical protein
MIIVRRRLVPGLLVAMLEVARLLGAGGAQAQAPPGPPDRPPLVDVIAFTQDGKHLRRRELPADAVRELRIIVLWNVVGEHTQRLELITPDGALYRRYATAFVGVAHPSRRTPVEMRVPVGGTWIMDYSLFGTWRADVYLDDQLTPITREAFVLSPRRAGGPPP